MDDGSAALAAATVVARAFAISGDPADLVASFAALPAHGPGWAWTVELAAGDEHFAFLVSAYDLGDGREAAESGRAAMEADLAVMADAAALDTPGPRLVAQAEAGWWGIVVAASPATVAMLGGAVAGVASACQPGSATERERAADALLLALRGAERRAGAYLAAVGDGSGPPTTGERALAMFVADAPSLAKLSQALRLAVSQVDPAQQPPDAGPP
jgi:hypothetical protein